MMMYSGWFGLILFILVIYIIFSLTGENHAHEGKKENAIDILNERYAKGEISDEEYIRMKRIIKDKE